MIVFSDNELYKDQAVTLALKIKGEYSPVRPALNHEEPFLQLSESGLSLIKGEMEIKGDFCAMSRRLQNANLRNEMLVKVSGILRNRNTGTDPETLPLAIDATAGLGEDSFLLAAAGFRVKMYERDLIVAALLQDAIKRGQEDEQAGPVLSRMVLSEEDSIAAMKSMKEKPALILLDPMFPHRQKSSLVKKKFQLLHLLEKPCSDEKELMDAAFASGAGKIVVKRPLKGPLLDGRKPSYSVKGKAVRYDCYLVPQKEN